MASGIDGTLSLAMGLSIVIGRMVLITGDLALLHDSNGWLFSNPLRPPLVVLLIDNGGGGIFNQLNLEIRGGENLDKLFSMPQEVDFFSLDPHLIHKLTLPSINTEISSSIISLYFNYNLI